MGRYKEALAEYTLVLELYPGDIEMRLGRAYSLAGAKRNVEAGIEFREVLKRVPNERRARAALGLP
jgi:Flp pilus assembly protein TadD